MNNNNLTFLSAQSYEQVFAKKMDVEEALRYLKNELPMRTFSETIKKFGVSAAGLTDTLYSYDDSISKDSLGKKVRDWYRGAYEPTNRETYFMLCFAFGLDEISAELFLRTSTDCGFHFRSVKELTYCYALRTKKTYEQARQLFSSLPSLPARNEGKKITVFTETIALRFQGITDDAAFAKFIADNLTSFGEMHNTAYDCFTRYIKLIQSPDESFLDIKSEQLSIEELTEDYLRLGVPNDRKSDKKPLPRMIKKYWPGVTNIRRMLERTEDVGRKTLILLALVTEDGLTGDSWEPYYLEEIDESEIFEQKYVTLNLLLSKCGFSPIDPRSAFDWLTLWSMKSSDDEFISERMQAAIEGIFNVNA